MRIFKNVKIEDIAIAYIVSPFNSHDEQKILAYARDSDASELSKVFMLGRSLTVMEEVQPVFTFINTCHLPTGEKLSVRQIQCHEVQAYEKQLNRAESMPAPDRQKQLLNQIGRYNARRFAVQSQKKTLL